MKPYEFSLESVLKLRCHERDICRQDLARRLGQDQLLADQRAALEATRLTQFNELRSLEEGGRGVNIEASTSRRSYVERLNSELQVIDANRAELAAQIEAS
ncbi:MAG: hypothetical protein JSS02_06885, partial [Planctomycetes bacterium]|nr:hypothetical protein [Planctomycetota bacterium]